MKQMDDLISRQAAIDFIRDHSYPVRYDRTSIEQGMTLTGIEQALNEVPSVLPNPEKDRQESKDYCAECDHVEMCSWYPHDGCEFWETKTNQKTERWENDKDCIPRCSRCGCIPEYNIHIDNYYYSNFCPNCGARMEDVK